MSNEPKKTFLEFADASDLSKFNTKEQELLNRLSGGKGKYIRLILAALGSIPWFGLISMAAGLTGAVSGFASERGDEKTGELLKLWLQEHRQRAEELALTIQEIVARLDQFGAQIDERISSQEYLMLVRATFRSWDEADTQDKKQMFKKLITNAAMASKEFSLDDLVSLFINWLNRYHEAHFMVIRELYKEPDLTLAEIWDKIHPNGRPKDNSAEADLFRYIINELRIGGIIEHPKQADAEGRRLKSPRQTRSHASPFLTPALEDTKPNALTELGKLFVHYVMEDIVPLIGAPTEIKRE